MKIKCDKCKNDLRQAGGSYGGDLELTYFKCDTCDYTLLIVYMEKGSEYTVSVLTEIQKEKGQEIKKDISQKKLELKELEDQLNNQVKAEQFEKASITKNKIINIKNQIKKL